MTQRRNKRAADADTFDDRQPEGRKRMAHSMTGFGRGYILVPERRCTVEIKTVNSKYLDMQLRLPRILNGVEGRIREAVSSVVHRGKIEVYISYEDFRQESKEVFVDLSLLEAYRRAFDRMNEHLGTSVSMNAVMAAGFPDVVKIHSAVLEDDELWEFISPVLMDAIGDVILSRRREGQGLTRDVMTKCSQLKELLSAICVRAPALPGEFSSRLRKRIAELAGEIDQQRIDEQRMAAEVALYADKCSIDEEIVRLGVHIDQMEAYMRTEGPIGKKMDFLVQEIHREINTIGSKANDLTITRMVLDMKSLTENIREQIQNLE